MNLNQIYCQPSGIEFRISTAKQPTEGKKMNVVLMYFRLLEKFLFIIKAFSTNLYIMIKLMLDLHLMYRYPFQHTVMITIQLENLERREKLSLLRFSKSNNR